MKKLLLEVLLVTGFMLSCHAAIRKLNSGYEMPVLGLGPWTLTGESW